MRIVVAAHSVPSRPSRSSPEPVVSPPRMNQQLAAGSVAAWSGASGLEAQPPLGRFTPRGLRTLDSAPPPRSTREELITGFAQGRAGNCVTVAAIKAAMMTFGPEGVFANVVQNGDGTDVTMRDGVTVHVSAAELREAASLSRLHGPNAALLGSANLVYAAMAKRAMLENNDGRRHTFASACRSLNDGEDYREGAHWLGLDRYVREIPPSDIGNYPSVVAASKKHAVFSSNGTIDDHGSVLQANNDGYGRRFIGGYAIVDDPSAPPVEPRPVEPQPIVRRNIFARIFGGIGHFFARLFHR